jgi:REP element-mobilizing transposase RayT
MPFVKVYIHFVWTTKNRKPFLATPELRMEAWNHMNNNAAAKDIYVDIINGYADHCHCLVALGPRQTMSRIMKLIKGEFSNWINKEKLCEETFDWQDEYYAVSVSPSDLARVRDYILKQEDHHRISSFPEELESYLKEWGFQRFEDGEIE